MLSLRGTSRVQLINGHPVLSSSSAPMASALVMMMDDCSQGIRSRSAVGQIYQYRMHHSHERPPSAQSAITSCIARGSLAGFTIPIRSLLPDTKLLLQASKARRLGMTAAHVAVSVHQTG